MTDSSPNHTKKIPKFGKLFLPLEMSLLVTCSFLYLPPKAVFGNFSTYSVRTVSLRQITFNCNLNALMLLTRQALHFPFQKLGTVFWTPLGTVILAVFCLGPKNLIPAPNTGNLRRSIPSKSCANCSRSSQ